MYRTKAKGRFLFRDLAPASDFRRSGSVPDHNYSSLQSCSRRASRAHRFPYSSVITFAVRAFCSMRGNQFPGCYVSLVSDTLRSPHRFPCGPRLRGLFRVPLPVLFQTSFPILIRRSFRRSLTGSASGSVGGPFPALLRGPLPALRWLLVALSYWRIAPPLN
jgi:hypothetical protein